MINEQIYPKEQGDIQRGVRRVPLHYLSENLGGNGVLQHELLELCQLTDFYHNARKDLTEPEDILFKLKFTGYKYRLISRQEIVYNNLLDMVNKSESKFKEQIKFDLTDYYYSLIDFIEGVYL